MSTSGDESPDVPVATLGYADAAAELDTIIRELDQGLIDVDLLETRFRRAIEIVEELDRRIHGARQRVDELLPRLSRVGDSDGGSEEAP
jgi:exodeoxyribonuclease VII small subunit